ncbi:MAG: NADH-quinone oxidoreductase subunit A [Dehalococcoidia bacterium]
MPEQFGRVGLLVGLALAFPALPLVVSQVLYRFKFRPEHPDPVKNATYECGVESEGTAWGQFNARYYIFALGFVIFDVEVIFLYPWAVNHIGLSAGSFEDAAFALAKATLFIGVLALGLAYAWRRGALEWR